MSDRTLVTFLLDRTGSMLDIKASTIEAFNAYLKGLQDSDNIDFTLITFDTIGIDKVCFQQPVKQVQPLTDETYQPRMGTNLIDAACITIYALDDALAKMDSKPKVAVCIQTDGEENSSHLHTWEELRGLINERRKDGWQFNFMGAGIDAYKQASSMGISVAATMSYDSYNLAKTRAAFVGHSHNTAAFASGLASTTDYSDLQKQEAGDKFQPASGKLDLSSNAGLSASQTLRQPPKPSKGKLDLTSA